MPPHPGQPTPDRPARRAGQQPPCSHTERQTTLLVRANGHVYDTCWQQHEIDLDELVLAYMGYDPGTPLAAPPPEPVAR